MKKLIYHYPFFNVLIKELAIEKRRKQTLLVVIPICFAVLLIFPLIIEGRSFVSSEIIGTGVAVGIGEDVGIGVGVGLGVAVKPISTSHG